MVRNLRLLLSFLLLLGSGFLSAQSVVELPLSENRTDIHPQALISEDRTSSLSISDVLSDAYPGFEAMTTDNLDFTASTFWIKFELHNGSAETVSYVLETARPVTNKAILYRYDDTGQLLSTSNNGDDFAFSEREINHRKCLFPVALKAGESGQYLLQLESDGELLTAPLYLWKPAAQQAMSYTEQLLLGLYYGIFLFVAIIYLFFYLVLRERSFIYYVAYVGFIALLQLALDGYLFQYVIRSSSWLANHVVLVSAGLAVIFLLVYAKHFLKLKERAPKLNKTYNILLWITSAVTALSLVPAVYTYTFPIINITSLLATVFVPISIFIIRRRGYEVSRFFEVAFVFLIVGAVLFILRNLSILPNNLFTDHVLKLFSAIEVIFLSLSMANRYRELQKEKEAAQAETLKQLEEKNRLTDGINARLEKEVKERTAEIEEQNEELAEKNKDILDSIRYAKRIQGSILPSERRVKQVLPHSFIFYRPRDIVSGDFYWVAEVHNNSGRDLAVFAAADCTGHGVPGAFVSIVGCNFLELGSTEASVNTPAQALDFLSHNVNLTFNRDAEEGTVRDGMDIAMCAIDYDKMLLHFAGAKNPVYIIRKVDEVPDPPEGGKVFAPEETLPYALIELKGNKQAIGAAARKGMPLEPFTDQQFSLQEGDMIYALSDGYPDQFGGENGKKFMYKTFKRLLLSMQEETLERQYEILGEALEAWMKPAGGRAYEQIDDILVMGILIKS